ncbi:hypothetical protein TTHERM_00749020 (macronuclear) [Tetrahymena thermophila SB210]|uniref:Uncharacterized protein n=1 Tax=Tetrahymena thermophila (strain SB210) TaxID=312017 RepID=Q239S6_TETTS|nr:hypothetical protein TTHERM_00749020 [Tetrahymena thermophila SB210]EAR93332.4 hypothetical protein TTHERM_00749020 [Tetrahymena thermophila SB210]|eukprot:XP_001013577.4 hypothetical protein TTHERM_00749020 [Tetrahymena thermophila SB210]
MVDIQYNQAFDILVIALEDSILCYQQYQFSKSNNMLPIIYKLDNIQFLQFIADNLILTYDQQILHLNIQIGIIVNIIQFNSTQLVTSYSLNNNQDFLLVGFSDKQVLLYSLIDKKQFVFGASFKDPLNSSITIMQFIETEQVAYAVSSDGIIIQIDISNKQQTQQIDLKNLVSENPNTTIAKFLVDETYKRYIFCFLGQKKAYKNFIKDKIIDFSFVSDKVIAIFFIDKFELFLIQGENAKLVSQQDYSYPKILDYHFDSLNNSIICGFFLQHLEQCCTSIK